MKYNYTGLNDKEVINSRNKYGLNEIEKTRKISIFKKILNTILEPMFLLLIITASIYFILGEYQDGIIMLFFVVLIMITEFTQEEKTNKAIEELNKLSKINVKVIRNNSLITIDSSYVVVGDIIYLEEGDIIPADGIILQQEGFGVNESNLTGESNTVYKKLVDNSNNHFKLNMCYKGSNVTSGSAIIKVTDVGKSTEYGQIGTSLEKIEKSKTPLEKQVNKLIFICTLFSIIFFILVIIINFINNNNLALDKRITTSIISGITIAMATIPEEIPVVLTVFLALGAHSLAKKRTLTRNMKSVETLGSVSVLCTDKTGTLTQNKMTIKDVYSNDKDFINTLLLSCPINPYDPMEIAIKNYCNKENTNKLVYEYIFNNDDKMMGLIWNIDNKNVLCAKGAYESIIPLCNINDIKKEEILNKANEYCNKGYRVLAVAKNDNIKDIPNKLKDNKLEFVGLVALLDPPRYGVKESIKKCHKAGIRVIMITGDNGTTAIGIANEIGISHNNKVITGIELESMNDKELQEKVKDTSIFARVYPNHKMRIVKALQNNNEVVAMTGDGINDATSLKQADIGISMGCRGTNVAKEASDMILMDDNFNTIVDAIKGGRSIYHNIKCAIFYIIAIHIPIALTAIMVPLFKLPTLLLPIHIVLLELIIDPTSSIIFQRLKNENNVMEEKPRNLNDNIINKKEFIKSIMHGFALFLSFFGSYYFLIKKGFNSSYALTFSFSTLVLSNIFLVFTLQSNKLTIINLINSFKDKVIVLINSVIIIILILIIYVPTFNKIVGTTPLYFKDLLLAILLSILSTFTFDILKITKH